MPIINNTLGYEIKRDLNNVVISKIGTRNISVQMFYKNSCNSFSKVTNIKDVTDTIVFKIPFQDGKYKIRITSTDAITEEFEYKEYLLDTFNRLLDSIILDAQYYLCGCKCDNCKECNDEEGKSKLISKMLSFYILNIDYYSYFFNSAIKCSECSLLEDINCIISSEFITNKNNNSTIYDSIIGYLYYIFYLAEKAIYTCCSEQVENKFKIDQILSCLSKKNIDIKCIENEVLTNPNYYISDSNLIEI